MAIHRPLFFVYSGAETERGNAVVSCLTSRRKRATILKTERLKTHEECMYHSLADRFPVRGHISLTTLAGGPNCQGVITIKQRPTAVTIVSAPFVARRESSGDRRGSVYPCMGMGRQAVSQRARSIAPAGGAAKSLMTTRSSVISG